MTCTDARERFTDLVDDALDAEARAALVAHLATCAECRAELDGLRQTVTWLHGLPAPRAPAGFVDRVMAAAHPVDRAPAGPADRVAPGAHAARAETARRRRFPLRLPVDLPAGAAAFLLVAVGVGFLLARTPEFKAAGRLDTPLRRAPMPESYARSERPPTASERAAASGVPGGGENERTRVAVERDSSSRALADRSTPVDRPAPAAPPPMPGSAPAPATAVSPQPEATAPAPATDAASRVATAPAPPAGTPDPTVLQRSRDEARALAKSGGARSAEAPARGARVASGSSSDIAARLRVADRAGAPTAVENLVSRAKGALVSSSADGDESVLELIVPRAQLPRLLEGLRALGTLSAEIPPDLPPNVHVVLRIGA